jgi:deoxyribonuclease V|tara:strand:+ start:556 stop:888 length:333 start_codon:yes stop_codon:yes gene_type:complete
MTHPRNFGIASHIGVLLNITAIGFAKSKLVGECQMPANNKVATSHLIDNHGTIIGKVLRSRAGCKPVFVSIGHRIGLETSVKITIQTCKKYRIQKPLRQAHTLCRSLDRK